MLTYKEKRQLFFDLKELLSAGVPYNEILAVKKARRSIIAQLEKNSFSQVAHRYFKLSKFDLIFMSIFEKMGKLEEGFSMLDRYYEELEEQSKVFINQMKKPLMMSVFALIVMPLGQILTGKMGLVEYFFISYLPMIGGFLFYRKKIRPSILGGTVLEDFPSLQKLELAKNMNSSHFFASLGYLIEAGIDVNIALSHIEKLARTPALKRVVKKLKREVGAKSYLQCLVELNFDSEVIAWIGTHEASGNMGLGFQKVAQWYQEKATESLSKMVQIIPRVLYILVALSIGFSIISKHIKFLDSV